MADKDYNVKLNIQTQEAVQNIDSILRRLTDVQNSLNDMSNTELGVNVVVRNGGFQTMVASINKYLMNIEKQTEKTGEKIGTNIADGVDAGLKQASKKTANSGFKKASKEIADQIKAELEGSLSGLEKAIKGSETTIKNSLESAFNSVSKTLENTIAESVTVGMKKGMRNLTHGATANFEKLNLDFRTNFHELDDSLKDINMLANKLKYLVNNIEKVSTELKNLGGPSHRALYDQAMGMAREIAKTSAHNIWSQDNMSLKDKAHYDVENRRLDQSQQALEIAKITSLYRQQLEEMKAKNAEKREDLKLTQEQQREERKLNAQLNVYDKQSKREDVELQRSEAKLQAEQRKTLDQIQQTKEQTYQLDYYAMRNANRLRVEDTALEKAMLNFEQASLRVKQQQASTACGLHVDESAIAKAAQNKRDAEIEVTRQLLLQAQGYDKIKSSAEATVRSLLRTATSLQRVSSAISSMGGIFSSLRGISTSLANVIGKAGSTLFNYARRAASTIADATTEQYRQLELAQIGFTNFYGADQASELIKQIKEQAMKAPGVDAGDLASYVRQLAPVSEGNSQVALDAAMGMLKTIQYGGGEASEEMEYVIKNIRDVISKGTATTIDRRQFNRAMPIMEDVLESIGKSDFIKNGQLKIDKNNAKELLQAFADINNDPNSPVVNIFDQMANTLSGITDIIKQTFITRFNDTLVDLGFYDKVKKILQDFYQSGAIEKFYTFLAETANKILDFVESLNWDGISKSTIEGAKQIWDAIKSSAQDIMKTLGASDLPSLITKIMGLISNFIKGFSDGFNKIFQFVNWLNEKVGASGLNNLAGFMGVLASPLGNLMRRGFSVAANTTGLASRSTYYHAGNYQLKVEQKLSAIETWVKEIATAEKFMSGGVSEFRKGGIAATNLLAEQAGNTSILKGGSLAKNSYWLWNKAAGEYTSLQKDGTWREVTGLNNFKGLSGYVPTKSNAEAYANRGKLIQFKDYLSGKTKQWKSIGDGSILKGAYRDATPYIQSGVEKFKTLAGKMVKAFATYEIGRGISAVAGGLATSISGSEDFGKAVQNLGDIASAAIALGKQFGPLGAAAGTAYEGLKKFAEGLKDMQKAAREYADKMSNIMYEESATDIMETLINAFREQGKYNAGDEIDADAQAKMYDQIIADLKSKKSIDEVMNNAQELYFNTRATSIARRDLTERTKNVDLGVTATTPITDKTDKTGLIEAYNRLYRQNLITTNLIDWARSTMGVDALRNMNIPLDDYNDQDVSKLLNQLSATEITNFLKKNGLDLSSEEAVSKFLTIAEGTLAEFLENKEYNADLTFKIASGGENYNSWEELLTAAGFVRDAQYGWVLKAQLQLTTEANNNANKKADDLAQDAMMDAVKSGNALEMIALGALRVFTQPAKWLGLFNKGGMVKPIFRAGGGDTPARGVDTVPIMAQPGEFVMRKSAVDKFGTGVLNALNIGDLGKAAQLLGAKFSGNWNNSRSYNRTNSVVNKNITNNVSVFNRTRSGTLNSYNSLANRLATGF